MRRGKELEIGTRLSINGGQGRGEKRKGVGLAADRLPLSFEAKSRKQTFPSFLSYSPDDLGELIVVQRVDGGVDLHAADSDDGARRCLLNCFYFSGREFFSLVSERASSVGRNKS